MPIFRVLVPITGFSCYEVRADDTDDAILAVLSGEGEYDSHHSESNEHTDCNDWDVHELGTQI